MAVRGAGAVSVMVTSSVDDAAWAGQAAPSLKLGTSVLVLPIRNPVLLAKQIASLDFLSGGRVILGAGTGWMEEEFNIIRQVNCKKRKLAIKRSCNGNRNMQTHGIYLV